MPLAFPSGSLPEAEEIQFRDGKRLVPEYLAHMMSTLDTVRYTYDEAVAQVNNRLAHDHANNVMARVLRQHFRGEQ